MRASVVHVVSCTAAEGRESYQWGPHFPPRRVEKMTLRNVEPPLESDLIQQT